MEAIVASCSNNTKTKRKSPFHASPEVQTGQLMHMQRMHASMDAPASQPSQSGSRAFTTQATLKVHVGVERCKPCATDELLHIHSSHRAWEDLTCWSLLDALSGNGQTKQIKKGSYHFHQKALRKTNQGIYLLRLCILAHNTACCEQIKAMKMLLSTAPHPMRSCLDGRPSEAPPLNA
jgi:hypothetical protein